MTLPAPRFLNLAHRHALEWLTPEQAKDIDPQLVGALTTAKLPDLEDDRDDWADLGFPAPAWY